MQLDFADDLQADILIFSRDYSSLRRGNLKWARQVFESSIDLSDNPSCVAIPRSSGFTEVYRLDDLRHRTALKQHPVLFTLFQRVWGLLNPFHIKLVSRRVVRAFNEFLYEKIFGPSPETSQARPYATMDVDVDMKHRPGLSFCDFYDSLFEAVDNWAKSKLITEYALIARRIIQELETAPWLHALELHSKTHIVGSPSHQYAPWMHQLIKVTSSRQKFVSSPVSPKARPKNWLRPRSPSKHPQTAERKVRPGKDFFLSQIKELSQTTFKYTPRRRDLDLSAPTGKSIVENSDYHLSTPKSRPKLALKDALSPVSRIHNSQKKSGKLPSLIEEVMEQREHRRHLSGLIFQFE